MANHSSLLEKMLLLAHSFTCHIWYQLERQNPFMEFLGLTDIR